MLYLYKRNFVAKNYIRKDVNWSLGFYAHVKNKIARAFEPVNFRMTIYSIEEIVPVSMIQNEGKIK